MLCSEAELRAWVIGHRSWGPTLRGHVRVAQGSLYDLLGLRVLGLQDLDGLLQLAELRLLEGRHSGLQGHRNETQKGGQGPGLSRGSRTRTQ